MGATTYLDKLRNEFDAITDGITLVLERAADDGRDLSEDEQGQIERDDKRRDELERAIKTHAELVERTNRTGEVFRGIPRGSARSERTAPDGPPEFDLLREFPTPADYAITLHRAWALKDKSAAELLERATAHQLVADNPGIIPKPVVGSVISLVNDRRPFIASLGPPLPAPTGKFDRPVVTQEVAVDIQATEKTLTASQKMLISSLPVALQTFAGHLNISKQDIRWSQPSILQLVFDSFGRSYAKRTDLYGCTEFLAAITNTTALPTGDLAGLDDAIGAAVGMLPEDVYPDTAWMSPDVRGKFSGLRSGTGGTGDKAYNLPITGSGGDFEGLAVVVDARFPAGTLVVGASEFAEWWEDLEGFLSVDEPDVLGQLVGYAGYGDLLVTVPDAFVKVTGVPTLPLAAREGTSKAKS